MKRRAILLTTILVTLTLLTGFSFAAEKLSFGLSISTQVNPFYKAMADGMKAQSKAMGIEAFVLSADDKLAKQISDVEDLIQKKIDVLLINATQSGAQAVIEKAAKAGIAGFSRVLALELAKYGATSNVISPGAATRMTIPLMKDPASIEGQGPEHIAPVATWLASSKSEGITGQIFHVARGLVGIMQQPAVVRSFRSDEVWKQEGLDRIMPQLVDARNANVEGAKKSGEPERG